MTEAATGAKAPTSVAEATEPDDHQCPYRTALIEIDGMKPEDFKGDKHLAPAFQTQDYQAAFRHVAGIIDRTLRGVDDHQCAYRAALEAINGLKPEAPTGGVHLSLSFPKPDFRVVFLGVVRIVNRTLHNTDEYMEPLP